MYHEKVFERKDGSTVRLVAEYFSPIPSGVSSIECFAVVRPANSDKLTVLTVDRIKSLNGLSVEEYKRSPRRGLFTAVSYAEVIRVMAELEEKLRQ